MSKINWNLKSTNLLRLGVLVLGAFIVLLPLLVVFITSFAPPGAILEVSLKTKWSLANYRDAWERGDRKSVV